MNKKLFTIQDFFDKIIYMEKYGRLNAVLFVSGA